MQDGHNFFLYFSLEVCTIKNEYQEFSYAWSPGYQTCLL